MTMIINGEYKMTVTSNLNGEPIYFNSEANEWRSTLTEKPVVFPEMRTKLEILAKLKDLRAEIAHLEKGGARCHSRRLGYYSTLQALIGCSSEEDRRILKLSGKTAALRWVLQSLWDDPIIVNGKELTETKNLEDSQESH